MLYFLLQIYQSFITAFLHSYYAVSYTHLDVYKSQGLTWTPVKGAAAEIPKYRKQLTKNVQYGLGTIFAVGARYWVAVTPYAKKKVPIA